MNKSIHSESWNREGAERKFLTKIGNIRRETIAVQKKMNTQISFSWAGYSCKLMQTEMTHYDTIKIIHQWTNSARSISY